MTFEGATTYPYTFTWPHGGESVAVAGTFDDPPQSWTPVAMHLNSATGVHEVTLALLPDKTYQYKFLVDGEWQADHAKDVLTDDQGIVNHEVTLRIKEGEGNVVGAQVVTRETEGGAEQNGEETITTTTTTTTTTVETEEELDDVQKVDAGTVIEESADIAVEPASMHQANVGDVETIQAEEEVVMTREVGAAEIEQEQADAPIDAAEIVVESAPAHQHVFETAEEEVVDVQEVQVALQQEQVPIDTSEIVVESLATTVAAGKVIGVANSGNDNVLTVDELFVAQGPIDSDQIVVESLASHGVHIQRTENGLVETFTTTITPTITSTLVLENAEPELLGVPEQDTEVLASIDGPIEAGIIDSTVVQEITQHDEQVQELLVEQEQQEIEEPAATVITPVTASVDTVTPELDVNDVIIQEAQVTHEVVADEHDTITPELDVNGVMVQEAHIVHEVAADEHDIITPELDVDGVMVQEAHIVHEVATDEHDTITPELDVNGVMVQEAQVIHEVTTGEHDIDEKLVIETPPQTETPLRFEAPQQADTLHADALQAEVLAEAAAVMAAGGVLAETEQAQMPIQQPLRSPQIEEEAFSEEIPAHGERHLVYSDVADELVTAATAEQGLGVKVKEEEDVVPSPSLIEVEGINERIEVEAGGTQAEQEDYARVMAEAMLTASMTAAAVVAGIPQTGHAAHEETRQVLVDAGDAQQTVTATELQTSTELQDEATIPLSLMVEDTVAIVPNPAFQASTTHEDVSKVESVPSTIINDTESQKPNELDQVVPEVLVRETISISTSETFGDDTDTAVFEQRRVIGENEEVTSEKTETENVITLTEGTTTITSTKIVTVTQETIMHGATGKREYFVAEDVIDAQTGKEDLVVVETASAAGAAFVASQIAHELTAEGLPATVLKQRRVTVRSDEDADEVLVVEEVSASKTVNETVVEEVLTSKTVNETVTPEKSGSSTISGLLLGGILLAAVGVIVYQWYKN
ncbi:hypothetical protein BC937DRAFT_93866 [Endogone sp. FLAS-F59071]|nr:hypothetical protein BC937DRAFT_93866 [Endogone sp. FLAS-F59071]|eukprot:RUS14416.1 hypothetical protein BC937DRAFT_93866 [Endogone sp. FLAS-F59071]